MTAPAPSAVEALARALHRAEEHIPFGGAKWKAWDEQPAEVLEAYRAQAAWVLDRYVLRPEPADLLDAHARAAGCDAVALAQWERETMQGLQIEPGEMRKVFRCVRSLEDSLQRQRASTLEMLERAQERSDEIAAMKGRDAALREHLEKARAAACEVRLHQIPNGTLYTMLIDVERGLAAALALLGEAERAVPDTDPGPIATQANVLAARIAAAKAEPGDDGYVRDADGTPLCSCDPPRDCNDCGGRIPEPARTPLDELADRVAKLEDLDAFLRPMVPLVTARLDATEARVDGLHGYFAGLLQPLVARLRALEERKP